MSAASAQEVSAVVIARDAADGLAPLLASLDGQTLARERFEIVVVDNASRDATGEVAQRWGARVVSEPVPGRARARNRAMESARADVVAFIDADCVATPGWLAALLQCRESQPLIAGAVRVTTGERPNAIERFESLWRFHQESWVHNLGWAATANMLVRREVWTAIGGFDDAYRHIGEDADFCIRAGRAGFGLGFCAAAEVTHPAERELWPLMRRFFLHGYSSNQCYHRVAVGQRAWRRPAPALWGDAAMTTLGHQPESFDAGEWRRMRRLARLGYAARTAGSVWAEVRRAR